MDFDEGMLLLSANNPTSVTNTPQGECLFVFSTQQTPTRHNTIQMPSPYSSCAVSTSTENNTPELLAHTSVFTAITHTPISVARAKVITIGGHTFLLRPSGPNVPLPSDALLQIAIKTRNCSSFDRVTLCFMSTMSSRTSTTKTVKRQIEHYIAGPWHHPELVFTRGTQHCVCSVTEENGVRFAWMDNGTALYKSGTDDRRYWTNIKLLLTSEQALRAFIYCLTQEQKPFNFVGYYLYYLPVIKLFFGTSSPNEPSWTCVQLVCSALIQADYSRFMPIAEKSVTPTELYNFVLTNRYGSIVNEVIE